MSPAVRKKVLKMLDAGVVDDVYDEQKLDESRAQDENERLLGGEIVEVSPWEDDMVHMRVHARALKKDDYYEADPGIQVIMEEHFKAHAAQAAMKMPQPAMDGTGQNINAPPATPVQGPATSGPMPATPPATGMGTQGGDNGIPQ